MLQRHQAAEQLLARGLGGRQDDAGLQEVLHPPQQILAALSHVGVPAKDLRGGRRWALSHLQRPWVLLGTHPAPKHPHRDPSWGHGGSQTQRDEDTGVWGHWNTSTERDMAQAGEPH